MTSKRWVMPCQNSHTCQWCWGGPLKLSKRHGSTSVLEFRDQGYLPEALLNFMALVGWSLDDKTDISSREELIINFSLERVNKNAAFLNYEKLSG